VPPGSPTTGDCTWLRLGWTSVASTPTFRCHGPCRPSDESGTAPSTRLLRGGPKTARKPIAAAWMGSHVLSRTSRTQDPVVARAIQSGFRTRREGADAGTPAGSRRDRFALRLTASTSLCPGSAGSGRTSPPGSSPAAWRTAQPASWPPPSPAPPTAGSLHSPAKCSGRSPLALLAAVSSAWTSVCTSLPCCPAASSSSTLAPCNARCESCGESTERCIAADHSPGAASRADASSHGSCPRRQPATGRPPQAHHRLGDPARHHRRRAAQRGRDGP
jgi:hypothetical protein